MHTKKQILEALDYAYDARLKKSALQDKYKGSVFIENKQTDTQGFMWIRDDKTLIISFRGTQQLQDWLTDLNAFHMVFPYGNIDTKIMVHRGFMLAYLTVRQDIHDFVKAYKDEFHKISVRGHSLGGALATLCAVDMQYNFDYPVDCVPTGNPMVGNKFFVESYNKRVPNTTRVFMRKDPVPKLPPEWFEAKTYEGFSHTAVGVAIGPKSPFAGIIMWLKKITRKADSMLDDIFNHDIELYKTEVEKLNIK